MASITIRKLDDEVKRLLRIRAAEHGRSMEEEARSILREALLHSTGKAEPKNAYEALRQAFEPLGGFEFERPEPEPVRDPPNFD